MIMKMSPAKWGPFCVSFKVLNKGGVCQLGGEIRCFNVIKLEIWILHWKQKIINLTTDHKWSWPSVTTKLSNWRCLFSVNQKPHPQGKQLKHFDGLVQERCNSIALAMEWKQWKHFDGLVQERRNSSALAMDCKQWKHFDGLDPSI